LLRVTPSISVLTNLEEEHVDTYPDFEIARLTVRTYLEGTRPQGAVVYWQDDPVLDDLVRSERSRAIAFGFSDRADVQAVNLDPRLAGTTFDLRVGPAWFHKVFLPVPGRHNVQNLLAAVAALVGLSLDVRLGLDAVGGLATPARRLELLYRGGERLVVSDYAHHPTEVRAAVDSLRLFHLPLTLVFQPHRFSRFAHFWPRFADVLSGADRVVVTDVYGAGEPRPQDHDCRVLTHAISEHGCRNVHFVPRAELEHFLTEQRWTGVVAFLGAGDIADVAHGVAKEWSGRGDLHADSPSASVEA
jgi:UDP-N-acetylmuramate--alanine ligase